MSTTIEAVAPTMQEMSSPDTVERVVLYDVSWETYERLLREQQESSSTRFTYDHGTLEIMVLSARHEALKHTLSLLVSVVAEELDIDVYGYGSTTFRREDLARGFEPDACFYAKNAEFVRNKKEIDLTQDPPPDLVIEIDITSPSLNKFPLFAAVSVPEVWRYDGAALTIFTLKRGEYQLRTTSLILPGVTGQMITQFLEESDTLKRTVWLRRLREWVRTHASKSKN
jgi:Uma2 family endonuclease